MTVMVSDSRVMTIEEMAAFLGSSGTLSFRGEARAETYAWIETTLRKYGYSSLPRADKGVVRRYVGKMTGYSPAQVSRREYTVFGRGGFARLSRISVAHLYRLRQG
ncbi:hypothetical protein H5T55_04255, partial [Candidatus Bipolaricaulota bacterium]|nr:hypothetical protein [Candidatus Bipolaricaulota bacterium]